MKILITGSRGYIGSALFHYLQLHGYDVMGISRQTFDLTDTKQTNIFFSKYDFDIVIHCAVVGGKRTANDGYDVFYKNMLMFENLMINHKSFKYFINFDSGAALDRLTNIINGNLFNAFRSVPKDFYGLSKNIITKRIYENCDYYNFRIFALFDHNEEDTRFIKSNITRYLSGFPMIVHQDRYFDFFFMEDLLFVVKYFIENIKEEDVMLPRDLNLVYEKKFLLSEIAEVINCCGRDRVNIKMNVPGFGNSYTGQSPKCYSDLFMKNFNWDSLVGLETGIMETYYKIREK